jgi:hypothetical protein
MRKASVNFLLTVLMLLLAACTLGRQTTSTALPIAATEPATATFEVAPTQTAASVPPLETPTASGPCVLVASATTNVYQRPFPDANVFGVLASGESIQPAALTADGWIGFDPGTAQAANFGVFRLRWVPLGETASLDGDCSALPVVVGPPVGVCFLMAMEQVTVYAAPDSTSAEVTTLYAEDYAAVLGRFDSWLQVDLATSSLGLDLQGWVIAEFANFNGPCESLPEIAP